MLINEKVSKPFMRDDREESGVADICECLIVKHCGVPEFCQSYCGLRDPLERSVVEEVQKKCATDRNKCSPFVKETYAKVCKDLDPATCLRMYHCPSNVPPEPKECPSKVVGGDGVDKKTDNVPPPPIIADQAIQNIPKPNAAPVSEDLIEGAGKCTMLPVTTVFSLLQILGFMTSLIGSGLFISVARYRKR